MAVTQIHPEHSPSESINVEAHANVNYNRFTLPKDPLQIIVATLLALSVLGNVTMYLSYRDLKQTVDLDRYDDNTFITTRFSDLKARVDTHDALIQTYGLQKALKEK